MQRLLEQQDHLLRHGARAAHLPRAVDGRAVEPVGAGRATTRCSSGCTHLARHPAQDHHGRRRDRAGEGAGDGPGRRRAGGDRHRASAGRRGRRLRRASRDRRSRRSRWARPSSTPASTRAAQGGYARALTRRGKSQGRGVLTQHIQAADLVITTAAIPGQAVAQADQQGPGRRHEVRRGDRRPVRRGRRQLRGHAAGRDRQVGGVTIVAPLNVPSLLGEDASELYAKNQYNLLALMMKDNVIDDRLERRVVASTALTHAGKRGDLPKPDAANGSDVDGLLDRHDGLRRPVHLHARRVRGLGDHRPCAGHPAHAVDVRLELRPRHRRGRRHFALLGATHAAGAGHRLFRRAAGRGQCGRRLRRHRPHAGDVPVERQRKPKPRRRAQQPKKG